MSEFWTKFRKDFKERFMTFETAKGMYLIPAGLIGLYFTWYELQYLIQVAATLVFWYMISEGLRKVTVNRIKQQATKDTLVLERLTATSKMPKAKAKPVKKAKKQEVFTKGK